MRNNDIQQKLRTARKRGRNKNTRCLDPLLSEAHALERLVTRDVKSIERALRTDDFEGAGTHRARLGNFSVRSLQLASQSGECGLSKKRVKARRLRARRR